MKQYKVYKASRQNTTCYFMQSMRTPFLSDSKKWMPHTIEVLEQFLLQHQKQFFDNTISQDWTFNVLVVGKSKIQKLNADFRHKNKATDVLSFPALSWNKNKKKNMNEVMESSFCLGDIVICKEKTISQAKTYKLSVKDEFIHLLTHGFLHLLGYDHERSSQEAKIMQLAEDRILDQLSRKLAKTKMN